MSQAKETSWNIIFLEMEVVEPLEVKEWGNEFRKRMFLRGTDDFL